jgi:hypothetical protein
MNKIYFSLSNEAKDSIITKNNKKYLKLDYKSHCYNSETFEDLVTISKETLGENFQVFLCTIPQDKEMQNSIIYAAISCINGNTEDAIFFEIIESYTLNKS